MNSVQVQPADELLDDPWYGRLKEYLIEATGMAYYANKDADLARRVRRRLSEYGADCATYLERLRDPRGGPAEMDALIAEITIGESYFFRHREHFDALRDLVLPDLIARNGRTRQLRIWCAACADGAEPYSLSLLLRRELAHLLAGWNLSILGTDINRQCLTNARAGRFEDWSFRSTPEDLRRGCFVQRGKCWTIAPEYREGVSFQFHNLAESAFPPAGDFSAFDLIICRNAMIYFSPELMQRIVARFHDCLTAGAWLLVGPSEPNMTYFTSFRAVNAPGVTLYQKPARSLVDGMEPLSVAPVAVTLRVTAQSPAAPLPPAQHHDEKGLSPRPTLAELSRLASQGEWENAIRSGRELLKTDRLNPLVHFHYALALGQTGEYAESERALRKAIYLDRKAAPAHYHLGLLLQGRGDFREATRYFDNALRVLEGQSGDTTLAGGDGMTVAELTRLVRERKEES